MTQRPTDPPSPGDPRSTGPRPEATWRDVAWGTLATSVAVVTLAQLGRLAYLAATDPDVVLSTGMLLLAFVVTVVWLLTAFWVSMGSWRRTVWGCPFDHVPTAATARRCPRHRPAGTDDTRGPGTADGGIRPPAGPPGDEGG